MKKDTFHIVRDSMFTIICFGRFLIYHFYTLRGMQTASSLAYTTLLSIIPLITVMFGLFVRISVLKDVSAVIQEFVFTSFVPHFGQTLQGYISNFSTNASQLTITGIMALVLIAVMLMATIDNAFNQIWLVTKKRNPVSRLLVYWSVLTMGPLLIGTGLASTSYMLSLPLMADMDSTFNLTANLLSWLPFLTTSIAFSLIYILVPNCYVNKYHALAGGIISAILFEFAKYGFGIYIRAMPSYENIYGAISIIPLFLIWIYVSWVIVLFGANITFCLSSFHFENKHRNNSKSGWNFIDVLHILFALFKAQQLGCTMTITQLRKESVLLPHYYMYDLLEHLQRSGWINQSSNGEWLLSKDMTESSLFDLYKTLPLRLPLDENEFSDNELSNKLKTKLANHAKEIEIKLSVSIADFFKNKAI